MRGANILREQVEDLRVMHVAGKVIEILKLVVDRIEELEARAARTEDHLHDKFGERP